MKNKNLLFRYIFLFIVLVVSTITILNIYKNDKIQNQLMVYMDNVKHSYNKTYSQSKKISELIFFNNILYDKKIVDFYKEHNEKKDVKEKLYSHIKNKFFYFKSYGVKQMSFYLPNNKLLLKMKDSSFSGDFDECLASTLHVNKDFEDIDTIEICKESASLRFVKPLFDDELNYLGSIELSFSLDYFTNELQNDVDFNILFMFNKKLIDEKIPKENKTLFISFPLSEKFMLENTKYVRAKYDEKLINSILNNNATLISSKLENQKLFAFIYEYKQNEYPVVFLPVFNKISKKNNAYVIAYSTNIKSQITSINHYFKIIEITLIFIYLLLLTLAFYLNKFYLKNKTTKKKYNDLRAEIDKYVVMIDTDMNGIITDATQAFCDICAYSKNELIGKNINIIRHPDMSKRFFGKMWRDLKENKKWEGELKNIDRNGNSYWVKGTIFPKYDTNGKIIGYVSIRVNITDEKQLKKINHLLKEDLSNKLNEIKMRDKDFLDKTKVELMASVLDSVSHEWKKPISNMSIELTKLEGRIEKNDMTKSSLKNIHFTLEEQLKNLSLNLNDFKSYFFSNDENDKYNVFYSVQEAIDNLKTTCEENRIKITLDSKKEIYCYGLYVELKHIVINLLKSLVEQSIHNKNSNAQINISVIKDESDILIKCIANINNINKEIFDEVFNSKDEKVNKDINLNLYITKLLVKKSGAKIWFEHTNEGIIFYIKLISQDRRNNKRL